MKIVKVVRCEITPVANPVRTVKVEITPVANPVRTVKVVRRARKTWGDAAAYESGDRYCWKCGTAVWIR